MNVLQTFLTHSLHTDKRHLRDSSQAHGENYLQTKLPSAHKGCEWGWAGEVGEEHPMTKPAAQNQTLMVIDLLVELEPGLSSRLL